MSFIGKSVAALAVAIALVFIVNAVGDIYNPTRTLDEPVYRAGLDTDGGETQTAEAEEEPEADIFALISQADAADGETAFRQCSSCHTADPGGANRVGPNLGNVVGADIAHRDDFNYSDAVAGHGGQWTYENLDAWLTAPGDFIPGNKMTFAGVKDAEDRAAIIKFLMSNTENPPPVPEPQAAAAEEAPAEGEGTAAEEEQPADAEEAPAEGDEQEEAAAGGAGFAGMVASADPAAGQKVFNQCRACHTFEIGGPNRVGPNLGNVVGAAVAHRDDFNYSDALAGHGGQWTYENLNAWLENPKDFAPGNKMTFGGLKSEEDRAAVVAFLREHAENPPPLDGGEGESADPAEASETQQEAEPEPEGAGDSPAPEDGEAAQ